MSRKRQSAHPYALLRRRKRSEMSQYEIEYDPYPAPPLNEYFLLKQQFRASILKITDFHDISIMLDHTGDIVHGCLHNEDHCTEARRDVLEALVQKRVIVYVNEIIGSSIAMTLYDLEGKQIPITVPNVGALDVVEPLCPILLRQASIEGLVTRFEENYIYIQPTELLDKVFSLFETLKIEYEKHEPVTPELAIDKRVAFKSSNGNWYRGKILTIEDEFITVFYLDHGFIENVQPSAIRELLPVFKENYELCVKVKLSKFALPFACRFVKGWICLNDNEWNGEFVIQPQTTYEFPENEPTE